MKDFIMRHPFITFLMVDTICTTIYNITVGVNSKNIVHQTMDGVDRVIERVKEVKDVNDGSDCFTDVEIKGFAQ